MKRSVKTCLIITLLTFVTCEANSLDELQTTIRGLPTSTRWQIFVKRRSTTILRNITRLEDRKRDRAATMLLQVLQNKTERWNNWGIITTSTADEIITEAQNAIGEIRSGLEFSFEFTNSNGTINEYSAYFGNDYPQISISITNTEDEPKQFISALNISKEDGTIITDQEDNAGTVPPGEEYSFVSTSSEPMPAETGLYKAKVTLFCTNKRGELIEITKSKLFWVQSHAIKINFEFTNSDEQPNTELPYPAYHTGDSPEIEVSVENMGTNPIDFIMAWKIEITDGTKLFEIEEYGATIPGNETNTFSATAPEPLPEADGLLRTTVMILYNNTVISKENYFLLSSE